MKLTEKIKTEVVQNSKQPQCKLWLRRGLWGLIAFVLSLSTVSGVCSPFAVSLLSVSGKKEALFAAVGAAFGYFLTCAPADGIRYCSAVLICTLGTLAIHLFRYRKSAAVPMVIAFLSVLSTGLVLCLRTAAPTAQYALLLGEAILAMGGSFFFFHAVNCNLKRLKNRALPVTDLTCVLTSAAILLGTLSALEIHGVSPARVLGVFIILVCVRFGTQRWSMIVALCLGFALGISREDSLFLLGAYGFSALVSSLFTTFSSLGIGFSFTLSVAFFAVAVDLGSFSVCCVAESLLAALGLALLPSKVCARLSALWDSGADIAPDGSIRQSLIVRLRFAAAALAQVSEHVRDVREKCSRTGKSAPAERELRMVAADQFFSIADMLEELAFEFDEAESFDLQAAGRIRRMLGEYEIYPENISVIADKFGRVRVEILAPKNSVALDSPKIRAELSRICKRTFEPGRLSVTAAGKLLCVTERPHYKMCIGFAQYCAEGNLCGDTIKTVNDARGHQILIISDGMGTGSRAALDGAMGAGLLSKLLCAGFGFDSSLKVVNSALLVKSREESLATLDCASVDLYTGKCEFYKAGAPASYICKDGRLTKCELSSMPAGILRGIEFAKRTTLLGNGDEILLFSDGITDIGSERLEAFLRETDISDPNEKASALLRFAVAHTEERHRDDMSVIVARLAQNEL